VTIITINRKIAIDFTVMLPKIDIDFWGNWQVDCQTRRRPSLIKALRDMFLR